MRFELVNATYWTGSQFETGTLRLENGYLVNEWQAPEQPLKTLDCQGLHVLPGVIDSQVHFREPGLTHKEDLATGTASAALGGVTTVFEMPNTSPSTTDEVAFRYKLGQVPGRCWTNVAFYMGASAENAEHDKLAKLQELPGCCGVKIFMGSSTGDLLVQEDAIIAQILKQGRKRVAVHAEDNARLQERAHLVKRDGVTVHEHPNWRDVETALKATKRLVAIAEPLQRNVHVLHITTAEEMEFLAGAKKRNPNLTVEVTPQHLTLVAPDCYDQVGSFAQMNPPIREARHREALWQALNAGVVDVLGSDHAPHTLEEKQKPYPKSPSGMPGVQTMLPLMLNHVHEGRLSLPRLIELLCERPVSLFNLQNRGRIAPGYEAHLTLVDLKAQRTITSDWLASRCGWSPFEGMQVTGWPVATIINGQLVMQDDELLGRPVGRLAC